MANDGRIELPPLPEEQWGSWEGARWEAIREGASWTFRERMQWNEEMIELAERFRLQRERRAAEEGKAREEAGRAESPEDGATNEGAPSNE